MAGDSPPAIRGSDFPGAAEATDEALACLDETDPLTREVLADQLAVAGVHPPSAARAFPQLHAALADISIDDVDDPGLLGPLAAMQVSRGEPAERVRETAGRALAAADQERFFGVATGFGVGALMAIGELDLAMLHIEQAATRAGRTGSPIGLGFTHHWWATLRYKQGDLRGTISHAEAALEICKAGWDVCRGWVVPLLASAHLDRGQPDEASSALAPVDDLGPDRIEFVYALEVQGRLAADRGDHDVAAETFHAAGRLGEAHGIIQPTLLAWRSSAALAWAHLGELDKAAVLADAEVAAARRIGARPTLGAALRVAGLVSGGEGGRRPQRSGRRARTISGGAAARPGSCRPRRGTPWRGPGLRGSGAPPPRARHRGGPRRRAAGRTRAGRVASGWRPAALTEPGRRHADADRAPSRQARRGRRFDREDRPGPVRDPQDVEFHLANTYRKLGISGRQEAARHVTLGPAFVGYVRLSGLIGGPPPPPGTPGIRSCPSPGLVAASLGVKGSNPRI